MKIVKEKIEYKLWVYYYTQKTISCTAQILNMFIFLLLNHAPGKNIYKKTNLVIQG